MRRHFAGFLVFLFVACIGGVSIAQTVLTVISATDGMQKSLTYADLAALEQVEVTTSNEYVDGEKRFRGPLVREIFEICDLGDATRIRLTAANDYQIEIDVEEFFKYDVILAMSMDDVVLTMRDKGPIWIIYPMKDHKELRKPIYSSRLIWQLVAMEY